MRSHILYLASVAVLAGAKTVNAGPVSLPPVNLGETSFEDGIAYPGWFFEEIGTRYHADQFTDSAGGRLPGELTTVSSITHLAYTSTHKFLGGYIGAEFLVPVVDAELNLPTQPRAHEFGVGDLSLNPLILQWNDVKFFGKPFFQRFDLQTVEPTGEYDSKRTLNIGNHVFSVNPYYCFTILPTSKLEVSARLHYLWNSENENPYVGLYASSIQPGQAFHANAAVSYEVFKSLRAGVSGYVLQQFTDDKINGNSLANSEERTFGIGPGLEYIHNNKWWLTLDSYFETGVENRPEGVEVVLRFSRVF